jgi:hypothetical protein
MIDDIMLNTVDMLMKNRRLKIAKHTKERKSFIFRVSFTIELDVIVVHGSLYIYF